MNYITKKELETILINLHKKIDSKDVAGPTYHNDLLGVTSDQHHPQSHTHVKAHITDTPWAWSDVSKSGSNLTDLATRQHSGLTDISADQHHAQLHASAHNLSGSDPLTSIRFDSIGIGCDPGSTYPLHVEKTITVSNTPAFYSKSLTNPGISTHCNLLEAYRSGNQTKIGPTHLLRLYIEDNSISEIDLNSGALCWYSHIKGNNSGGTNSWPDYWGFHQIVELTPDSTCRPRMIAGGDIDLQIKRDYTIPSGGVIRGLAIGCNYGETYTKKGNVGYQVYGRWERGIQIADDDVNNLIEIAMDCGQRGITDIKKRTSNPAVADMYDGELNFGLVGGVGKIYWRDGSTIYVFNHDATIT